jgi:hypothetical protein
VRGDLGHQVVAPLAGGAAVFDPVSLIVTALVQALIAGAQELGRATASDSYHALKSYLIRKYGRDAAVGIAQLEQQPRSSERQESIEQLLRRMGADEDPELLSLARHLVDVIEEGAQADPLEQPRRAGGVHAIDQILNAHVQRVGAVRAKYMVEDSELLSSRVASAANVPAELRSEISSLHNRIRDIIEQVAMRIEGDKYRGAENLVQSLPARHEQERANRLVQADKSIHVSYETLRLTVSFFSELNESILARIEQERSSSRQAQMMFGNAVMIYELADFVIKFIETFTLGGVSELEALHHETLRRITKSHQDQERLAESAGRAGIEPAVRDGVMEDV